MRIRIEYLGRLLASKRQTIAVTESLARQAYRQHRYQCYWHYIRTFLKQRREMECLAYWLHTMLFAKGATKVPVPQKGHSWTVADLMNITQLGSWLNQAD